MLNVILICFAATTLDGLILMPLPYYSQMGGDFLCTSIGFEVVLP